MRPVLISGPLVSRAIPIGRYWMLPGLKLSHASRTFLMVSAWYYRKEISLQASRENHEQDIKTAHFLNSNQTSVTIKGIRKHKLVALVSFRVMRGGELKDKESMTKQS